MQGYILRHGVLPCDSGLKVKHDGFYLQKEMATMFYCFNFFVLLAGTIGWNVPGYYKDATYLSKISRPQAFSLNPIGETKVAP